MHEGAVAYATRSSALEIESPLGVAQVAPPPRADAPLLLSCGGPGQGTPRRRSRPTEGGNHSADLYPTIPFVMRTPVSPALALATKRMFATTHVLTRGLSRARLVFDRFQDTTRETVKAAQQSSSSVSEASLTLGVGSKVRVRDF